MKSHKTNKVSNQQQKNKLTPFPKERLCLFAWVGAFLTLGWFYIETKHKFMANFWDAYKKSLALIFSLHGPFSKT